MAYDEALAERIRKYLAPLPNIEEKKMMGGLGFMFNEKMCIGIIKDELMCRIDPALHDEAVEKIGCRTMDFTKHPMRGFVLIEPVGIQSKKDFDYWMNLSLNYNKEAKSSKKRKKKI